MSLVKLVLGDHNMLPDPYYEFKFLPLSLHVSETETFRLYINALFVRYMVSVDCDELKLTAWQSDISVKYEHANFDIIGKELNLVIKFKL